MCACLVRRSTGVLCHLPGRDDDQGAECGEYLLPGHHEADRFKGTKMRFVIENPPFGTPWGGKDAAEGVEQAVQDEYKKGFDGAGAQVCRALAICRCCFCSLP